VSKSDVRRAATPQLNPTLAVKVGRSAEGIAFYRLALEAMIGMALGRDGRRAVSQSRHLPRHLRSGHGAR